LFCCTGWYSNGFARRCVHCGLQKWCEDDEEPFGSDLQH
jgi:hypothetical protein